MLCLFFLLVLSVVQNDSARVLAFFPCHSISHQVVFRPITQELARLGHQVTVITPDPAFPKGRTPPNLTEIDIHDVSYQFQDIIYTISSGSLDLVKQNEGFHYIFHHLLDAQFSDEGVKEVIDPKKNQYDLLLLESLYRNALGLSHVFKVPVVQISSLGFMDDSSFYVGCDKNPILYPNALFQKKSHNHTLWEKLRALYSEFMITRLANSYDEMSLQMLRRHFGEDVPGWKELGDNVDMLLLNSFPIWDSNRPVPPNVVYLGGLPLKPDRAMPKDLQAYLDNSKNGVIYISFGTNVDPSMLPVEKINIFQKVFSKLPYDVVWKWNPGVMEGKPDNVKVGKWFPQSDLLKHPKIKLFITQGGLQSTDESILGGVPLLGVPMLADQWFNTDQYVKHGIGKQLEMIDINEDTLIEAIKAIVDDSTYRKNVEKMRDIMYNQPTTALERAIYWIEHVLEYKGARHLRAAGANKTIREYYELDLLVVLSIIAISVIALAVYIIVKCFKLFLKRKSKVE